MERVDIRGHLSMMENLHAIGEPERRAAIRFYAAGSFPVPCSDVAP
jgi:hypothetical protein